MVQVSSPHEGRSGWGQTKAGYSRQGPLWVRLYVGLLTGPSRPKIQLYQGDSRPFGGMWISCITGPRGPAIR